MCRVQDPCHSGQGQGHTDHFSVFCFRFLTSKLLNRFSNNCIHLLNILRRCVICKNHALKFKVKVVPEGHSFFISTPYLQHASMNCKTIIHRLFSLLLWADDVSCARPTSFGSRSRLEVQGHLSEKYCSAISFILYMPSTWYFRKMISTSTGHVMNKVQGRTYSQGQGHRWPLKVAVEKSVKFQWFKEFPNNHLNWITVTWQCAICKICVPLIKVKVM